MGQREVLTVHAFFRPVMVEIPGYSIIRRDREEVEHGGDILNTS